MRDVFVQAIGFAGVALFLLSYQVRSNRRLFVFQMLGCALFGLQFFLLGAYSGCLSLLVNLARNAMLTRYRQSPAVRWKGWAVVFSALAAAVAALTWSGPASLLPLAGTVAGTAACWTNNARSIRLANLCVNAPCMLAYDALVGSWGGVVNESVTIVSIVASIVRFGWSALDGDAIGREAPQEKMEKGVELK